MFRGRHRLLLSTLEAETGGFTSAAFSPQGDFVVTGGRDQQGPRGCGKPRAAICGRRSGRDAGQVVDVAFSSDGARVVTACLDSLARLWNVANGAVDDAFRGHAEAVLDVHFAALRGLSGRHGKRRWNRPLLGAGPAACTLLGHKRDVLGASFRPGDGDSILTTSEDGFARLWDPFGEPPLRLLARADQAVTAVAVNSDGSLVASGRENGGVQVLTPDGQVRTTFSLGSRPIASVGWTKEGTLLAASTNGRAQIRADSGRQLARELNHRGRIRAAAISRDGALAATAGQDGNVRLWRLPGGTPLRVLDHDGPVISVAIDPAGRTIASASGSAAFLWPVAGGEAKPFRDSDSEGTVTRVALGKRGLLATASDDSDARLWNIQRGTLVKRLSGHMDGLRGSPSAPTDDGSPRPVSGKPGCGRSAKTTFLAASCSSLHRLSLSRTI